MNAAFKVSDRSKLHARISQGGLRRDLWGLVSCLLLACGTETTDSELTPDRAIAGIESAGGQSGQEVPEPSQGASAGEPSTSTGSWPSGGSSASSWPDGGTAGGQTSPVPPVGGSGFGSSPSSPIAWFNEVKIDPPGTDGNFEFIELQGQPGAALTGYWLASVEGDADSNRGQIDRAIDISDCGSDRCRFDGSGLLVMIADPTATPPPSGAGWRVTPEIAKGGLENGTNSLLLGTGAMPEVGSDWDTNDDGILEVPATSAVVDSISWTDGGSGDAGYAARVLGPKPKPQAIWICEDSPGVRNWRWGQLEGEAASMIIDVLHAIPSGLTAMELSPGAINRCEMPAPAPVGGTSATGGASGLIGTGVVGGNMGLGGTLSSNCAESSGGITFSSNSNSSPSPTTHPSASSPPNGGGSGGAPLQAQPSNSAVDAGTPNHNARAASQGSSGNEAFNSGERVEPSGCGGTSMAVGGARPAIPITAGGRDGLSTSTTMLLTAGKAATGRSVGGTGTAVATPSLGSETATVVTAIDRPASTAGAPGWWSPGPVDPLTSGSRSLPATQASSGATARMIASGSPAPEVPSGCNLARWPTAPREIALFWALLLCQVRWRVGRLTHRSVPKAARRISALLPTGLAWRVLFRYTGVRTCRTERSGM